MTNDDWQIALDRYAAIPDRLSTAFAAIGAERVDQPPAAGGWSAREVLDHVRACDALATPRLMWLLVRDPLPVAGIDILPFTALLHAQALDVSQALTHFAIQRAELVGSLRNLPPQDRLRTLQHEEYGPMALVDLLEHHTWHEEAHCAQIEALVPAREVQTPNDVRTSYDAVADRYADHFFDELQHKPFDCQMLDWLAARVDTSGIVCDLGCGPGQIAHYLHARGARACGIDLSSEMVKVARARNPGIAFAQGDMLALDDVADGAFAGIAAFYSIVNLSDNQLPQAFRELRRVLQDGGWVLMSFHVGDETRHLDEFLERRVTLDFTFFTPSAIKKQLTSAGFEVTEVLVRDPYAGAEYPSQRAYVFARASTNPTRAGLS